MSAPAGRVTVLLNARAGIRRTDATALGDRLGRDSVDVVPTEPAALRRVIERHVQAGAAVIGVAGGDGTMRTAARALIDTNTALLCVPIGTLNHFARRAGIASVEDAADALGACNVARMAVGAIGDDIFLNTLTFGEYARVVRIRERLRGRLGKWPAAAAAFATTLASARRMRITLDTSERTIERNTSFVWIGIGWGSFPRVYASLERRSRPDLEVAVHEARSRTRDALFLVRLGAELLRRRAPVRDRALEMLHTREVTLTAQGPLGGAVDHLDGTADGEPLRVATPVQIHIRDGALGVVVRGATHEPVS